MSVRGFVVLVLEAREFADYRIGETEVRVTVGTTRDEDRLLDDLGRVVAEAHRQAQVIEGHRPRRRRQ